MERVFLDANVLFSAAHKPNARLLELWKLKSVSLRSSRYALEEARVNLSTDDQQARLTKLAEALTLRDAGEANIPPGIDLPEKVLPILQAAIEGHANYLLTGDVRHFGPYFGRQVGGVKILRPAQYLRRK